MLLLLVPVALAADITVDADCSLDNAVRSANGEAQVAPFDSCEAGDAASGDNTGADTITVTVDGTVDGTITLDATLQISTIVTIEGNGFTIDGGGSRAIRVQSGDLTLNAATVTGGWSSDYGGGISASGSTVTLTNSVVRHNAAGRNGGGILAYNSDLTLTDSAVTSNVTGVASMPVFDDNAADNPSDWSDARGGGIHFNGAQNTFTISRSGISGNQSTVNGGGLYISAGSGTIDNATINGNSAKALGGGIYNAATATLTHVTIIENTAPAGAGINDGSQLKLYNSIVTGNTGGDCRGTLNANVGNLIRDGSCDHDGMTDDPQLLLLSGAPAYYQPDSTSPVVDAGDTEYCLAEDQRGILRGQDACDIGAAEYAAGAFAFQIQSARAAAALAAESGGDDSDDEDSEGETSEPGFATAPDVPGGTICNILPAHIVVADASSTTQCKEVGEAGVGNKSLIDGGFIYAVDIFGYVSPPVNACFAHDTGSIVLLDAAFSPRAIVPLNTFTRDGMRCAQIDRPGTAVLMPPSFAEAGIAQASVNAAAECMVTTTDVLNLRAEPSTSSAIRTIVGNSATLQATERSGDWYRVSYNRIQGWLHGDYLITSGGCG